MEDGFIKANSENLPKIDAFMIALFFGNNSDLCSAEFRNTKTSISSRQSYGDDAVGYVQLKWTSTLCTVKAKICPEHKVRNKQYSVTMIVNEEMGEVHRVKCNDCPVSEGCCKHSIAFLMWTHRSSEEPARTDIECYWKKSRLAKIGTTLKFITLKDMSTKPGVIKHSDSELENNHNVFQNFVEEGIKRKLRNCQILKHQPTYEVNPILILSMHYLSSKFNTEYDVDKFMHKIRLVITQSHLIHIENQTRAQHNSPAWHELRYARVTASRAYDISRCHTSDGSLIALLMGAKVPVTPAIDRGRKLENLVKKQMEINLVLFLSVGCT